MMNDILEIEEGMSGKKRILIACGKKSQLLRQ